MHFRLQTEFTAITAVVLATAGPKHCQAMHTRASTSSSPLCPSACSCRSSSRRGLAKGSEVLQGRVAIKVVVKSACSMAEGFSPSLNIAISTDSWANKRGTPTCEYKGFSVLTESGERGRRYPYLQLQPDVNAGEERDSEECRWTKHRLHTAKKLSTKPAGSTSWRRKYYLILNTPAFNI